MRARLLLLALSLGWSCQPPPPSQTATGLNDPNLSRRLDYIVKRLNKIEGDMEKVRRSGQEVQKFTRQAKADQSVLLEDLQSQIRSLRGSMDVVRHDLTQLTATSEKIHRDQDARLMQIEEGRPVTPSTTSVLLPKPSPSPPRSPDPAAAQRDLQAIDRYNQILRIILDRKDYDTAITQFEQFIKTYPQSSLASNAQYWKGEGYFAKGEYRRAINEFQTVVDRYPTSEKVCDAILKQGYSFAELKDQANAKLFLTEVQKRCPQTQASARAEKRLQALSR